MTTYADEYAAKLNAVRASKIVAVGGGGPTTTADVISILSRSVGGEIFVKVDPSVLRAVEFGKSYASEYMWPIVVEIDAAGDTIIHVTDGDRAQFGEVI